MKGSTFDVYCKTGDGKRIIIEMQSRSQTSLLSKSVYYSTFAIQDQLKRGIKDYDFTPVYVIYFLCEDIEEFEGRQSYITRVNLCTTEDNIFVVRNLNYIYVELNKFRKTEEELSEDNVLDGLLYSIKHISKLTAIPDKLKKLLFRKLYEAARFAEMSEMEQHRYIRRMTTKEDIKNQISYGIRKGIERDIEKRSAELREEFPAEGRAECREKGRAEGMACQNIAECTGIALDEVERILKCC